MSRAAYQAGIRAMQGIKDRASKKCDPGVKETSSLAWKFSGAVESTAVKAADELKRREESLRMVMYLSCWGPN